MYQTKLEGRTLHSYMCVITINAHTCVLVSYVSSPAARCSQITAEIGLPGSSLVEGEREILAIERGATAFLVDFTVTKED